MSRGEIWWCDVPNIGRRPVLILTRDIAIPVMDNVLVAILTRTVRGIPTEVLVDRVDGVPRSSAISLDNIRTIAKRSLVRRIATLSASKLDEVCEALRFAVAC